MHLLDKLIAATASDDAGLPLLVDRRGEMFMERSATLSARASKERGACAAGPEGEACRAGADAFAGEAGRMDRLALSVLQSVQTRFPRYERADFVHFKIAWLLCKAGDDAGVQTEFRELVRRYPLSTHTRMAYLHFGARLKLPGYAKWLRESKPVPMLPPPSLCPPAVIDVRVEHRTDQVDGSRLE